MRQFLCNKPPIQLASLRFIVRRLFLSSLTLCNNLFEHDRCNWYIPTFCSTKFKTLQAFLIYFPNCPSISYVYWTVHHLDSWIKRDQLDVTCFIISLYNAQHVSDVNTCILRSLRLICWVISWVVLLWFDVCCCYVVVPQPAYGYHTTPAKTTR